MRAMSRRGADGMPPGERRMLLIAILLIPSLVALIGPSTSLADHESDNELTFEPVADSPSPGGSGVGTIEFRGGAEPDSRWTITFQFAGLQPGSTYVTVVQGRTGEDGSPEATAFSSICEFLADGDGTGGCWHYLVSLRRLGVVQVRLDEADGPVVLQATRHEGGPGSMSSMTNFHSLALTATPRASPDVPGASPVATP